MFYFSDCKQNITGFAQNLLKIFNTFNHKLVIEESIQICPQNRNDNDNAKAHAQTHAQACAHAQSETHAQAHGSLKLK